MVTPSFKGYCPNCYKKRIDARFGKVVAIAVVVVFTSSISILSINSQTFKEPVLYLVGALLFLGSVPVFFITAGIVNKREKRKMKMLQDVFIGRI